MLNHITLMGRLTADPQLRYTTSGTPVASFTVACDRDFGDKATDFISIVAWKQAGEFASKYFTKGMMVAVDGRLQLRDWTDQDGNKRRNAEVVANHLYFAERKREESQGGYQAAGQAVNVGFEEIDGDGDLPF